MSWYRCSTALTTLTQTCPNSSTLCNPPSFQPSFHFFGTFLSLYRLCFWRHKMNFNTFTPQISSVSMAYSSNLYNFSRELWIAGRCLGYELINASFCRHVIQLLKDNRGLWQVWLSQILKNFSLHFFVLRLSNFHAQLQVVFIPILLSGIFTRSIKHICLRAGQLSNIQVFAQKQWIFLLTSFSEMGESFFY